MLQTLVEDRGNMGISKRIKDGFAFPAVLDQFGLLEYAQLVGNRGLAHIEQLRDIAHTHFRLEQYV